VNLQDFKRFRLNSNGIDLIQVTEDIPCNMAQALFRVHIYAHKLYTVSIGIDRVTFVICYAGRQILNYHRFSKTSFLWPNNLTSVLGYIYLVCGDDSIVAAGSLVADYTKVISKVWRKKIDIENTHWILQDTWRCMYHVSD